MENLQILIRLSLAAIIGGMVGAERERYNRPAGLRTHILVTLGSCLVMIVSTSGFDSINASADRARVAAQVVSGIGFLGAGTIFKDHNTIRGLTTAAGLWVCAGLGLAIGIGMYEAALIATTLVIISLSFLNKLESNFSYKNIINIEFKARETEEFIRKLEDKLEPIGGKIIEIHIKNREYDEAREKNYTIYHAKIRFNKVVSVELFQKVFMEVKDIESIYYIN